MEQIKLDKLLEKNCPVILRSHYTISINPIIKDSNGWSYLVQKSDLSTDRIKTTYFYSTNYLALKHHRERISSKYNEELPSKVISETYQGIQVKPNILEIIFNKFNKFSK